MIYTITYIIIARDLCIYNVASGTISTYKKQVRRPVLESVHTYTSITRSISYVFSPLLHFAFAVKFLPRRQDAVKTVYMEGIMPMQAYK